MRHFTLVRLSPILVAIAVAGTFTGAHGASSHTEEPKPCTTKKFETKEVEKACKAGGQKAAKALMKKLVKKAKAQGQSTKCKSCHKSTKDFTLQEDSVDKLKKLLAL